MLITAKEKYGGQLQSQHDCLGLKIKKDMIKDAIFILSDRGNTKVDKYRENEANKRVIKDLTKVKKGCKL